MMNRALLADIVAGIRTAPGRWALSVAAVTVAITALTLLLIVLAGLRLSAARLVRTLGVDVVMARSGVDANARRAPLPEGAAALIEASLPGYRAANALVLRPTRREPAGPDYIIGVDAGLPVIQQWDLVCGRPFDPVDVRQASRNVVITEALATQPGWELGRAIDLEGGPFTIIGILRPPATGDPTEEGGLPGGERVAYIPSSVAAGWQRGSGGAAGVDSLVVRVADGVPVPTGLRRVQSLLADPALRWPDSAAWVTPALLLREVTRLRRVILLTVGLIALLCCILAGTTLVSLSIANVRDRVAEIGLRVALGAVPRDIALLFVGETVLGALCGGLLGTASGHLGILAASRLWALPHAFGLDTLVLPLLGAALVGALAALVPAREAARLPPVLAFRNG